MSCHKFGSINKAIGPSDLNHFTLRRWTQLSAVPVLRQNNKCQTLSYFFILNSVVCYVLTKRKTIKHDSEGWQNRKKYTKGSKMASEGYMTEKCL